MPKITDVAMGNSNSGPSAVAALDFGTTFSGYAYSFSDEPENIKVNGNWANSEGYASYKTPTSILTNERHEFVAMGYDAEDRYGDSQNTGKYHLYRHFKMVLHKSKNVSLATTIKSEDGTERPAVDIFGLAICFLKEHLLERLTATSAISLSPSQIRWVITVPAIWGEQSKQFMRKAAKQGGCITEINADNLILALEPEAASLCCRRPLIAGYRTSEGIHFPPETKYMVIDCGGGTVDITAHQTMTDGNIREILPASGGPWGGFYIDKEFEALMGDIFGKDFWNRFKSTHPQVWIQFLSSFEKTKKTFNGNHEIKVAIPRFLETLCEEEDRAVQGLVKQYANKHITVNRNGCFILGRQVCKQFFDAVIGNIIDHIKEQLEDLKLADCKYIFMVGGLSGNAYVQDQVKKNVTIPVLYPTETQLAVLKGAVLFGHSPSEIRFRMARRTYGYKGIVPFDEDIHDQSKKYTVEGIDECRDIFKTLVRKGDLVEVGKTIETESTPFSANQTEMTTDIYAINGLPRRPVQYTDAPEVEFLGRITTRFERANDRFANKTRDIFTFGSTEIKVRVIHKASGKEFSTTIDFLSEHE